MIGVVTTAFGHAQFIRESMASVDAQTDRRYCHVVVDDASPDETWAILQRNQNPQRIIMRLERNVGLASAFHAGVSALPMHCRWILKVDADDKIDPRYVAEILSAAVANPQANVIFAPAKHFGLASHEWYYPRFEPRRMREVFMIPGPAAYRRELWEAVGGYDRTMRSAEDWDFYIRAQLAVGLRPLQIRRPGLFWYYRVHEGHRASAEGQRRMAALRRYWAGHTKETALAQSRSWGAWCAEQEQAA